MCLIAVLDLQMCVRLRFWISRCVFDCGSISPDVCLIAVPDRDVCLIVVLDLQMCV